MTATSRLPGAAMPLLLATSILLSSATQLRVPGTPVGPGELLLAGFVLVAGASVLRVGAARIQSTTRPLLFFWGVAIMALAGGWFVGLTSGESIAATNRDAAAYLFCASFVIVLVLQHRGADLIVRAGRWLVFESAVVVGGLLAFGLVRGGQVGMVSVWYYDVRFRGWAANPNQMALLLAPLPWLALALATVESRSRWSLRAAAVILVGLGLATRSDALLVAWSLVGASVALIQVFSFAAKPTRSLIRAALGRVVMPLALITGSVVVGWPALDWAEGRVAIAFDEGGQGADRITRWAYGLEAVAQSPVVGFGPGSFSGPVGPFSGQEAHNTLIDWATSSGLVGLAALLILGFWALGRCLRARSVWAIAPVAVLVLFMQLHYVLRQPLAWFYLMMAVVVADLSFRNRIHATEAPQG